MKKFFAIFFLLAAFALLLTGCGSRVANERKIQEDLASYTKPDFLNDGEEIKSLEIDKRQTDKGSKTDIVWCNVTIEDEECSYQKGVILTYGLYDKGGWLLDSISVSGKNEWIITPLTGIKEDNISDSLKSKAIAINGESWEIIPKDISIIQHDTDLKSNTDTITAKMTIEDEVQKATGELTLIYTFYALDGLWKIETISGEESFAVSEIEGKELDISEEKMIEALSGGEYQYGAPKDAKFIFSSDLQTITIDKSEISNFVIDDTVTESKGTYQYYICHCTLTKPHAEFTVNATLMYYYAGSDGWLSHLTIDAMECTSINMQGDWKGSYSSVSDKGQAVLSITDCSSDGTISGIYSYTPNDITEYAHTGSYYVSGKMNLATMWITLDAGEWIQEPSKHLSIEKANVSGRFYVDESRIEGKGHRGNVFNLT